jgi:hypothetical protein
MGGDAKGAAADELTWAWVAAASAFCGGGSLNAAPLHPALIDTIALTTAIHPFVILNLLEIAGLSKTPPPRATQPE